MQNLGNFNGFTVYLNAGTLDSVVTGGEAAPSAGGDAPAAGTAVDPNAGQAPAGGDMMSSIWLLIFWIPIMIVAYILMSRPQRKREKQQKEMLANLRVGDEVVTAGGFFGRIADVGEDSFMVEFGANRGVRIPVLKSDVVGVRSPKMTPPPVAKAD